MARIRTVKPGFFATPDFAGVPIEARFLLVGLFTEADDDGRLMDSPKRLAGAIFPHDEKVTARKVDCWLGQLVERDKLVRYGFGAAKYVQIVNWSKHQKISHPLPSLFPPPPDGTPV